MRYLIIMAAFVLFLIVMICRQSTPQPTPQAKPVVVYRTVERPAKIDRQSAADLKYLSDVAERREFRKKWKQVYGTECPQ
jgi:hypothetical protein